MFGRKTMANNLSGQFDAFFDPDLKDRQRRS